MQSENKWEDYFLPEDECGVELVRDEVAALVSDDGHGDQDVDLGSTWERISQDVIKSPISMMLLKSGLKYTYYTYLPKVYCPNLYLKHYCTYKYYNKNHEVPTGSDPRSS